MSVKIIEQKLRHDSTIVKRSVAKGPDGKPLNFDPQYLAIEAKLKQVNDERRELARLTLELAQLTGADVSSAPTAEEYNIVPDNLLEEDQNLSGGTEQSHASDPPLGVNFSVEDFLGN